MQTSFMHPPFGFALFYLRSVASKELKTSDIYRGAIPFVFLQLIMVAAVILFPGMVTANLVKQEKIDINQIQIDVPKQEGGADGGYFGGDNSVDPNNMFGEEKK
jgi:hypothetical protein